MGTIKQNCFFFAKVSNYKILCKKLTMKQYEIVYLNVAKKPSLISIGILWEF